MDRLNTSILTDPRALNRATGEPFNPSRLPRPLQNLILTSCLPQPSSVSLYYTFFSLFATPPSFFLFKATLPTMKNTKEPKSTLNGPLKPVPTGSALPPLPILVAPSTPLAFRARRMARAARFLRELREAYESTDPDRYPALLRILYLFQAHE